MKKIWNQLGHSLFAEDESSRKTKHILKTVFFFYILVLLKVIVFKYPLARLEAIAASWTKEVVWEGLGTANFTLFKTIRMYIRYWGKLNSFENLFGNVLAFVPLGFLLPFLQKESRRFWILFLDAFVLVCCIELFQLFTAFGAFDVDDILLNCGCAAGICVFFALPAGRPSDTGEAGCTGCTGHRRIKRGIWDGSIERAARNAVGIRKKFHCATLPERRIGAGFFCGNGVT